MTEAGITQMPVLEDNVPVGSFHESSILAKLLGDRELFNAKVSDIMDKSFPVVAVDTSLKVIKERLQKHPAVLVEDFKRITGIITRSDVLDIHD